MAESEGAKLLFGGGTLEGSEITGGQFVQPTIFTGVLSSMRIAQEKAFRPVLSFIKFEDEVIPSSLRWLDPVVQLQPAVDPVDALVVPGFANVTRTRS